MSELIDRQAAIEAVGSMLSRKFGIGGDLAEITLAGLPSAQIEIIRCRNCKHRPVDSEDTQGFGVEFPDEKCPCQCEDGWYSWRPDDEWFCANAERRTDD